MNGLGAKGAKFISQANWPAMSHIDMRIQIISSENNSLGDEGAKYLSKAQWPDLLQLFLSNSETHADTN